MKFKSIRNALVVVLILQLSNSGCKSKAQNDALDQANAIQSEIKKTQPGGIATSEDGWMMKAKINGKDWQATSMLSPDHAGRIYGENNGESISLPYYDRRSFLASAKSKLDKGVDMMLNDDIKLWGSKEGEMEITKVDDNWAEGKFSYTATGFQSDKTIQVTDGSFRISMATKH
ncbi:MAG: hypothetical protein Q8932_03000 [Bacteroidota bacterium]|nr:hypothetical protein [Bacteroidota bacterium]